MRTLPSRTVASFAIVATWVLASLSSPMAGHAQTWTDQAPIPTVRWTPAVAVVDGVIYVFGGQEDVAPYAAKAMVEAYDTATDSWATLASMPTERWGAAAAVVDGKIYVVGGLTGSFSGGYYGTAAVEAYDPEDDSWTELAPMGAARGWCGAATAEGGILAFGGYDESVDTILDSVERYEIGGDEWSSLPSMPQAQAMFATAVLDGAVYVAGGSTASETLSDAVLAYDVDDDSWSEITAMPTARSVPGAAAVGGQLMVVGGRGGDSSELEAYDPVIGEWSSLTPMPTPREGLVAAEVDGDLYAIAGSTPLAQGGLPFHAANERAEFATGDDDDDSSGDDDDTVPADDDDDDDSAGSGDCNCRLSGRSAPGAEAMALLVALAITRRRVR